MEVAAAPPPRRVRARGRTWKKAALGAVIVGAVAAFFLLGGHHWLTFERLKEHREELLEFTRQNYAAMLVAAVLVYTAATAASLPAGLPMSLAAGLLFGKWVGTAVVVVAATVGAWLAFLSARYLFADVVRRRMGPRLKRLARGFEQDAFNYILFIRLVPVFPFWLMNLVPAFTPVSARTFFVATGVGIIPGSFVFVNLGESLGRIERPGDLVSPATLFALALLGVLSLVPIVWKKTRTRFRERRNV
ncbi:MAG TPA: TVP38/TMEM64 family protein [Longimicrobium sp.]|nr:TVP38/TMEM64 family protein [Longimicrobium sp.]